MKNNMWIRKGLMVAFVAINSGTAFATEGGGSIYPNGGENYLVSDMPPPGVHVLEYLSGYNANRLNDNNGNQVPINFNLNVTAAATRLIWVTDQTVFGGQLAFHAIAPLVNVGVSVNGAGQTKSGLGDMTFGPGLGYHISENLHYIVAVDINAPTGGYNKNDMINLGRNYWNAEPLTAVTYTQPNGINADLKVMYDFNGRNNATDYRSGQELHADYALGWGFSQHLVAGIGGYIYQQMTNDTSGGTTVQNNLGRTMAIGPSLKYDNGKGWFVTLKYEKEFDVVNRPEGSGWWVKMKIPM